MHIIKATALAVSLSLVGAATAQAAGYLKIDGIDGESQRRGVENVIDISALSYGASSAQDISMGPRRAMARSTFEPITISKQVDAASPALLLATARGQAFDKVTLVMEHGSGRERAAYYTIELSDVRISSVSASLDDEGPGEEEVSLSFGAIKIVHTGRNPDGSAGDEHEMEYSVQAGR